MVTRQAQWAEDGQGRPGAGFTAELFISAVGEHIIIPGGGGGGGWDIHLRTRVPGGEEKNKQIFK